MIRHEVLANNQIYHIFNRGVDKKIVFFDKRDYSHALETINYYRFLDPPLRFSHFLQLNIKNQSVSMSQLESSAKLVKIIAFCLMPNHYHLILKQENDDGISKFISIFQNSYVKYVNLKHQRIGPLFQGPFKSVRVVSNEQLLHLSRYIHLNPINAFLIKPKNLDSYQWSSYAHYVGDQQIPMVENDLIFEQFADKNEYRAFTEDVIEQQNIDLIRHLTFVET